MSKEWEIGRNWHAWVPLYGTLSSLQEQPRPYDHAQVWIMRPEWPAPLPVNPQKLHPMFNVAGLLWTPDPPLDQAP